MSAAALFQIANVLPLPIWALWILAPRSAPSRALAAALWPWQILAALYVVGLTVTIAEAGGGGGSLDFGSLAGVMRLFDEPWGALTGWVHYLCFDLFVARWIMNDAPHGGYRLAPVLFFTLMAGPVGLLLYTIGRRFFQGNPAGRAAPAH
jgi:hypothetical protein